MARIDEQGREILDNTPVAMPAGFERPESIHDKIKRMIRSERLAQEAQQAGFETPEEADDFDIGDDYDPRSPYELDFDQEQRELRQGVNEQNPEFIEERPISDQPSKMAARSHRDDQGVPQQKTDSETGNGQKLTPQHNNDA